MSPTINGLALRDTIGDIESAPQTFSSWDSCMTKAYCKWPAIFGIVLASLIVFSIVWCFARCLCCGVSCCCSCFKCCGCFESCTRDRGGRDRPSRHKEEYSPMPYQGYQAPPGPMAYQPSAPQFATFDAPGKKIHEDSLPAMPSWDTAQSRRIEDHSQDMEMEKLSQEPPVRQRTSMNGYGPITNGAISPIHSPYSNEHTDYMGAGGVPAHPYGSDLGSQRLGQNQRLGHQNYSDFQSTPLSPAPTYTSNPRPQISPSYSQHSANADRFAPGAISPSPSQYTPNQQYQQYHQPYSPVESTRYEPTEYSSMHYPEPSSVQVRPPSFQTYEPPSQVRPPSLLQVGRKPVNGSVREM